MTSRSSQLMGQQKGQIFDSKGRLIDKKTRSRSLTQRLLVSSMLPLAQNREDIMKLSESLNARQDKVDSSSEKALVLNEKISTRLRDQQKKKRLTVREVKLLIFRRLYHQRLAKKNKQKDLLKADVTPRMHLKVWKDFSKGLNEEWEHIPATDCCLKKTATLLDHRKFGMPGFSTVDLQGYTRTCHWISQRRKEKVKSNNPVPQHNILFFMGSIDERGRPWDDGSYFIESVVEKIMETLKLHGRLVKVYVGSRTSFQKRGNKFKTDKRFSITELPTIQVMETNQRLVGIECQHLSHLIRLLTP